ncbi:ATP-binding protein [Actinoallomurus rhizosphaericola]|uniref:ATP-binding protein n=1 Tax=Actinoallomurus rhizosphaericola TaxID=2952536 RepID=UPI00209384D9|nr:ATP-binding protein [Actinoallomurus rhizosphaericola]MCO5996877.1 ATP-binding protein [Actinoallomurus rhizosphaericola]
MRRVLGRTDLRSAPESVAEARCWLAGLLGRDHRAFRDIELLTSELVTNAIKYAASTGVSLIVDEVDEDRIRVEVVDGGHPSNEPRFADGAPDFAEGGRGLHIVRMLAADSGVSGDASGRIVWFDVTF